MLNRTIFGSIRLSGLLSLIGLLALTTAALPVNAGRYVNIDYGHGLSTYHPDRRLHGGKRIDTHKRYRGAKNIQRIKRFHRIKRLNRPRSHHYGLHQYRAPKYSGGVRFGHQRYAPERRLRRHQRYADDHIRIYYRNGDIGIVYRLPRTRYPRH